MALLRLSPDGCPAEDWRGFFDDRAAIREVDGELPRVAAEALANRDTTAALRPPHQDGGRASVPSNSKPIARTSIARADGGKEDEHQAFFAKRIQLDRADERSDHDGTTPERVGERPVEHFCWCGKEAHFGFGVRLLKGRLGTWYCAEHRLEEGEAK